MTVQRSDWLGRVRRVCADYSIKHCCHILDMVQLAPRSHPGIQYAHRNADRLFSEMRSHSCFSIIAPTRIINKREIFSVADCREPLGASGRHGGDQKQMKKYE
jgi:hypothetical protein